MASRLTRSGARSRPHLRPLWLALTLLLGLLLSAGCSVSVRPVRDTPTPSATSQIGFAASGGPVTNDPTDPIGSPTAGGTVAPNQTPTATEAGQTPGPDASATSPAGQSTQVAPPPAHAQEPTPVTTSTRDTDPPTPSPTALPNPTSAPAPTSTRTPMPTPTPSPTPIVLPTCNQEPIRGFGLVWHEHPEVAQRIGCPLAPESGVAGKVQTYQDGFMLWLNVAAPFPNLDQSPWVVTLSGDRAGRYRIPGQPDQITWESDTVAPTGAFAWVAENIYTEAERLGPATSTVSDTAAAVQRFGHGTMLWVESPPEGRPMIYVVDDDLLLAASGTFNAFPDRSLQGP